MLCRSDWSRIFEGLPSSFPVVYKRRWWWGRINMKEGGRGCLLAWSKTDLYFLRHSSSFLSAAQINEVRMLFPALKVHTRCEDTVTIRWRLWGVNSCNEPHKLFTPDCSPYFKILKLVTGPVEVWDWMSSFVFNRHSAPLVSPSKAFIPRRNPPFWIRSWHVTSFHMWSPALRRCVSHVSSD